MPWQYTSLPLECIKLLLVNTTVYGILVLQVLKFNDSNHCGLCGLFSSKQDYIAHAFRMLPPLLIDMYSNE